MKNTNYKGDLAQAKIILELIKMGYDVYTPLSDHPKADLVAKNKDGIISIQCKYSSNGIIRNYTTCNKKQIKYSKGDFDFFAVYLPSIEVIVYSPIELGSITINTKIPNTYGNFWWYEDFLTIKNSGHKQKSLEDFKINRSPKINLEARKKWPTEEELKELIEEMPMT